MTEPPIPTATIAQVLITDDGEGKSVALGALLGTDFLVPREGDPPELRAVKLLILGLGHTFDQMQDVEEAHDAARDRVGDKGETLVDSHTQFKAAASAETFVGIMCGYTHEFLELLHHHEYGCLGKLEAWPGFQGCVDRMPAEAQDAWRRLRGPKAVVRKVLRVVRNAGAFHVGEGDIARALLRVAAQLPPPFFAHFTFGQDKKSARYIACDLAAQGIRLQAAEDAGIPWGDVNQAIEDVQALGVHLMPELVSEISNHTWDTRVMPS